MKNKLWLSKLQGLFIITRCWTCFSFTCCFFPPFQIAPISHGRGKVSILSFIRQSYSLKFRARSVWKFLQQGTGATPRIRISAVQYWNEYHYGLFWVRPWYDWNSITSPALKGQAAQRTQSYAVRIKGTKDLCWLLFLVILLWLDVTHSEGAGAPDSKYCLISWSKTACEQLIPSAARASLVEPTLFVACPESLICPQKLLSKLLKI